MWTFLKNLIKSIFRKAKSTQRLMEQLTDLAVKAVETTIKADLNGDGKVLAATELKYFAEDFAVDWAMKFRDLTVFEIAERYDRSEMLRYLAMARTLAAFAAPLTSLAPALAIPTRILSLAVETAYNLLTAASTEQKVKDSGLVEVK